MLDLNQLENEVNNLLSNETAESYNLIFSKIDYLDYLEKVKISGGYTDEFICSKKIDIYKPNLIRGDDDFSEQEHLSAAA